MNNNQRFLNSNSILISDFKLNEEINPIINNEEKTYSNSQKKTNMTIDQIIANLNVLNSIPENSKIKIVNDVVDLDNSFFQGINRYFYGDSRNNVIDYMNYLFNQVDNTIWEINEKIKKNDDKIANINNLTRIISGISTLVNNKFRFFNVYSNDHLSMSKIKVIEQKFSNLIDKYFYNIYNI